MAPRAIAALAAAVAVVSVSGAGAASAPRVPELERVVVVVFENKSFTEIIGQPAAPTFNRLAKRHALLTRHYAVARPSLPNYLALVSGSTQGLSETCTDCTFDAPNLADTIEASGRTWKTYAEGLPEPGFTGAAHGRYAKRHNPFLYFTSVVSRADRLRRVVPLTDFARDLARRRLPDFSLVIPDLCNGMHDCPVARGDAWLDAFLEPLLRSKQLAGGAVIVTFDEPAHRHALDVGRVTTLILGSRVRPGARSRARYTHYALLRTIEDAWGLPRLGQSARARAITDVWRSRDGLPIALPDQP